MPPYPWAVDPATAGLALRQAAGASEVDSDDPLPTVITAVSVVDGLHYLADLLLHIEVSANRPVLGHPVQTVDFAFARWALTDGIAAVDLASAALGRMRHTHPDPRSGREMDFGAAATELAGDPACGWWIQAVEADADYNDLKTLRDVMVHRVASKHATVSLATGRTMRAWSKLGGPPVVDVVTRSRDFATRHIEAFLYAAEAGGL
jgi:hypothetical protein